jgi:transglutaminase-like putative cysteine protease
MIYEIRHRTTYDYESRVTFARCVLRLTPPTSARQTVLRSGVTISPTPARTVSRIGAFDEATLTVLIDTPHDELMIEARSRVEVHAARDTLPFSMAWEAVRARGFAGVSLASDAPASFLYPTRRTPITPEITEYARKSFTPGREIVEAAADLMTRMHRDFIYDGDATSVSTPAAEAFVKKRGVCQDFAHIMICGLKGLGLPAAYVSGYLRTRPPPGRPRLEGADAVVRRGHRLDRLRPHQRHHRRRKPHHPGDGARLRGRSADRRDPAQPGRAGAEGRGGRRAGGGVRLATDRAPKPSVHGPRG